MTITAASAKTLSIHQDALSTQIKCTRCSYTHSRNKCQAYGKECYNYSGRNHQFTSLSRKPHKPRWQDTRGCSHTHWTNTKDLPVEATAHVKQVWKQRQTCLLLQEYLQGPHLEHQSPAVADDTVHLTDTTTKPAYTSTHLSKYTHIKKKPPLQQHHTWHRWWVPSTH